jgi:peptidoglycan/LPS O-acetylase OafA/YrhL
MGPGVFRLVLATLVVVQHFSRIYLGTTAVYVFFVLSGFWVTQMWLRKYSVLPSPYRTFVISRFGRVFPTFILVMAVTVAIRWWAGALLRLSMASKISSVVLLGYSQIPGGGYLVPAWSLDVEMQFYLVAPFIVSLCLRKRRPVLVLLAVTSVACTVYLLSQERTVFNNLLPYVPFFSAGMAACVCRWMPSRRFERFSATVVALTLLIIGLSPLWRGMVLVGAHPTPVSRLNGPLCAVLALCAVPSAISTVWRHSSPFDRAAGDVSYAVYLIHFPFAWAADRYYATAQVSQRLPVVAAAVLGTYGTSLLVLFYFDRPISRWRERAIRARSARLCEPAL